MLKFLLSLTLALFYCHPSGADEALPPMGEDSPLFSRTKFNTLKAQEIQRAIFASRSLLDELKLKYKKDETQKEQFEKYEAHVAQISPLFFSPITTEALTNKLKAEEKSLNIVQLFAYKTCVCGETAEKKTNGRFVPYKSCYQMLKLNQELICQSPPVFDTKPFITLQTGIEKEFSISSAMTEPNPVELSYFKYVDKLKANDPDLYKKTCKDDNEYVCVASCKMLAVAGAKEPDYECQYDVQIKNNSKEKVNFSQPVGKPIKGEKSFIIDTNINQSPLKISCDLKSNEPDKKYTCKIAKCLRPEPIEGQTEAPIKCEYDVHVEGDPKATATFSTTATPTLNDDNHLSITGEIEGKKVELSCPVEKIESSSLTTASPEKKEDEKQKEYQCDAARCKAVAPSTTLPGAVPQGSEPAAKPAAFTCEYDVFVKGTKDILDNYTAPTEVPTSSSETTLMIKPSIAGKEVPLTCSLTFPGVEVPKMELPKTPAANQTIPQMTPPRRSPPRNARNATVFGVD